MTEGVGVDCGDDVDLGLLGELVLDRSEFGMRRGFDQIIHPAVGQERGGGDARISGPGMLEGVVLLQNRTQIFQECAGSGCVFEMFDALPSDVQAAVAGDQIANERIAPAPFVERAGADEGFVGEEEIESESATRGGQDPVVECREVCKVRLRVCR